MKDQNKLTCIYRAFKKPANTADLDRALKKTYNFSYNKVILILFIITISTFTFGKSFRGKCVGISDGDTISVMRDGKMVKIRLEGIDCPEKAQAFGKRAKQFISNLLFGKEVKVIIKKHDRYRRIVGRVFYKNLDASYELVKSGFAWHYKKYSKEKYLARAERIAKKRKRGLWKDPHAIPPWKFRKKKNGNKIM